MAPLLTALFLVGAELASVVMTGSLTPGARVASGLLGFAGPFGAALAGAAEGLAATRERSRALTPAEYAWARRVFARGLPPRERLVLTDTIGVDDRAFTFPRLDGKITINMGAGSFEDPRRHKLGAQGLQYGEMFVHELAHAWQMHRLGASPVLLAAMAVSRTAELAGIDPYHYSAGQPFADYNLEQQAQIVSDWFVRHRRALRSAAAVRDPRYRYIRDHVRGARG